ncbi:putative DNA-binding protein [Variovorax sp. OAS795]|uniref:Arc family DNA-binding protein n=1 Tax=Variovorax sp. OAS795 TaxID=3034231 RepID=UPI00339159A5
MELDRYTRMTLRLPKELHTRLESRADETSKSLNAEIVARLEQSFEGADTVPKAQYEALQNQVQALEKAYAASEGSQKRMLQLDAMERSLTLMLASNVIALGHRILHILGTLGNSKEAKEIKEMEPEVLSAIEAGRLAMEHDKTKGELDLEQLPWLKEGPQSHKLRRTN